MSRNHRVRWGWLKGMYAYTILGAGAFGIGILLAPELTRSVMGFPAQDQVISFGVTGSVYLAFALLSILGLRSPLTYAPVLLLQLGYKAIWILAVVVPSVVAGTFPAHAGLPLLIYATYVLGDLVALPFPYLFSEEVRHTTAQRARHPTPESAA